MDQPDIERAAGPHLEHIARSLKDVAASLERGQEPQEAAKRLREMAELIHPVTKESG